MEAIQYFLRLAKQAFDLELSIVILVALVIACCTWVAFGRLRRVDMLHVAILLALPWVLLVWGTLREHTSSRWDHTLQNWSPWEVNVLHALAGLALLVTTVIVWRSKGRRVFMLSVSAPVMWWLFMAWFVSGMSITGDWL